MERYWLCMWPIKLDKFKKSRAFSSLYYYRVRFEPVFFFSSRFSYSLKLRTLESVLHAPGRVYTTASVLQLDHARLPDKRFCDKKLGEKKILRLYMFFFARYSLINGLLWNLTRYFGINCAKTSHEQLHRYSYWKMIVINKLTATVNK